MYKIWVIIFCLSTTNVWSQITRKMTIETGSSVSFIFNRWSNFSGGITKNNFTTINVYYNDLNATGPGDAEGWSLKVWADAPVLSNFFGSQTINLADVTFEIIGTDGVGNVLSIPLSTTPQEIAVWDNSKLYLNANEQIEISYSLGPNAAITNAYDGEYFINLEFSLTQP